MSKIISIKDSFGEILYWEMLPEDDEKICGNCEFYDWGKQDKPCCYCTDKSEFVECEE